VTIRNSVHEMLPRKPTSGEMLEMTTLFLSQMIECRNVLEYQNSMTCFTFYKEAWVALLEAKNAREAKKA
jgi:hypothetical protein